MRPGASKTSDSLWPFLQKATGFGLSPCPEPFPPVAGSAGHCYTPPPVKISVDDIRHVALLARLALTPAEEAELTTTLDSILQHMDQLNRLDTTDVEPTAHVASVAAPFRDDVVTNAPDADALLANAPARDDDLFLVPKIID